MYKVVLVEFVDVPGDQEKTANYEQLAWTKFKINTYMLEWRALKHNGHMSCKSFWSPGFHI